MERVIKTYRSLNSLATTGGLVVFGGAEDRLIPLGELKETFDLQCTFYNRSVPGLCLENAEKEAILQGKSLENLTSEEIYVYCTRSFSRS